MFCQWTKSNKEFRITEKNYIVFLDGIKVTLKTFDSTFCVQSHNNASDHFLLKFLIFFSSFRNVSLSTNVINIYQYHLIVQLQLTFVEMKTFFSVL